MRVLDRKDREILTLAQGDLPVEKRPFDVWAKQLDMDVGELLERMKKLKQEGILREIKGVLRHHKAGFSSGAMVIWAVPEDRIEEIGEKIADRDSVSHCYERPGFGKYNVFSMVHGRSDSETSQLISEIASATGIDQYKVFWSVQELKKSSMKYF
jgi:DNA-binding Lrp family transcriptional regulator